LCSVEDIFSNTVIAFNPWFRNA